MFVVLKTVIPEKGLLKHKKQMKSVRKKPAAAYKTEMGLPFYVVEIINGKNGIDWTSAVQKCGR